MGTSRARLLVNACKTICFEFVVDVAVLGRNAMIEVALHQETGGSQRHNFCVFGRQGCGMWVVWLGLDTKT